MLKVPEIPFSCAQHLITSTSGTTTATIQDCQIMNLKKNHFTQNEAYFERFSMNENLGYVLRSDVDAFNFFWNDVFPLGQFKNVFSSVDYFQCAILKLKILVNLQLQSLNSNAVLHINSARHVNRDNDVFGSFLKPGHFETNQPIFWFIGSLLL